MTTPRYSHRVFVPGSMLLILALATYAIVAVGLGRDEGVAFWPVLVFAFGIVGVTFLSLSRRPFRSIAVDHAGLHRSGELVVPAERIVAISTVGLGRGTGSVTVKLGELGWSTVLRQAGQPRVVVPRENDGLNTGGALAPGVLVTSDEQLEFADGPAVVGHLVPTWRSASLVEALLANAPEVDGPSQLRPTSPEDVPAA